MAEVQKLHHTISGIPVLTGARPVALHCLPVLAGARPVAPHCLPVLTGAELLALHCLPVLTGAGPVALHCLPVLTGAVVEQGEVGQRWALPITHVNMDQFVLKGRFYH